MLHGFTQNAECWGRFGSTLAARLAGRCGLLAVDAPGHGRSGHDTANLWTTADLVVETVDLAEGGTGPVPMMLVGYSMGGRAALHIALAYRERVAALVLIGATAGIATEDQRRQRRMADEDLARRFETEPLDDTLRWWLDRPLFARLSTEAAGLELRRSNRPAGLAASLRHCGTGAQDPLWSRLGQLTMPVLVVHGSHDTKFGAIGAAMADAVGPGAEMVSIEGTHAVHLEQPEATVDAIARFLDLRLDRGRGAISER